MEGSSRQFEKNTDEVKDFVPDVNDVDKIVTDCDKSEENSDGFKQDMKTDSNTVDNVINGKDSRKSDEKFDLNLSKNLRFGIEAILKVKANVTETLKCRKTEDSYKQISANEFENYNTKIKETENEIDDDSEDESSEEGMNADGNDVTDTCFPYVRLPASFQASRADDLSYISSQNFLNVGRLALPWPQSVLNDLRKERFGHIRRVGHPYQNRTPPKRKKPRTSFTRLQILELEKRFGRQKYLASTERSALAKTLKMSDAQVKTWFQNRRTKWRRQTAEERELERQAANRLLLSLQSDPINRKSIAISPDRMCLSQLQAFKEQRSTEI